MTSTQRVLFFLWTSVTLAFVWWALGTDFTTGNKTLPHDNFYWTLPSFIHWARALSDFQIPFFNFHSNGGVPFTQLIVQLRLLDPIDLLTTFISVFITDNLIAAFNLRYILICVINSFFVYLFLSIFIKNYLSKLLLITLLLISSLTFIAFRQTGFLLVFQWAGLAFFLAYLFFFKQKFKRPSIFFAMCVVIANSFHGYSYVGFFILVICLGLIFAKPIQIKFSWRASAYLALILFALPTLAVLQDYKKFDYPARTPEVIELSTGQKYYKYVQNEPQVKIEQGSTLVPSYNKLTDTGVFGNWREFYTTITPEINANHYPDSKYSWPNLNEVSFFIGTLLVIFMPLGFWYFWRHKSRLAQVFCVLVLLYMGPSLYLHELFYRLLPPMWPFRHSILIAPFIQILIILFAVKGFDLVYDFVISYRSKNYLKIVKLRSWFLRLFVLGVSLVVSFPFVSQLGYPITPEAIGFAVVSLFLLGVVQICNNKSTLRSVFVMLFLINSAQLAVHFSNISQNILQDSSYESLPKHVSIDGQILSMITKPAALHPGCYGGESGQAVRYPSIVNFERAIYSAPMPLGSRTFKAYDSKCKNIVDEKMLRLIRRWNVLVHYKEYNNKLFTKDESLYKQMEYILPKASDRTKVFEFDANGFKLANVVDDLPVNLFFDEHWMARCDEEDVKILRLGKDKVEEIGSKFPQSGSESYLEGGMLVEIQDQCTVLSVFYEPRFFMLSVYALICFQTLLIILLILYCALGFQIQSWKKN